MALKRSKTAFEALVDSCKRKNPTSRMNPTATSTPSSVGRSSKRVRIWSATTSLATFWLTRWAMNLEEARQMSLRLRLFVGFAELGEEAVEEQMANHWEFGVDDCEHGGVDGGEGGRGSLGICRANRGHERGFGEEFRYDIFDV
jgi:hypothetical protein